MKLEIKVSKVVSDEGIISDQNRMQWNMIQRRHDVGIDPCWEIEIKVKGGLIQGLFYEDVIHLAGWTNISRYFHR